MFQPPISLEMRHTMENYPWNLKDGGGWKMIALFNSVIFRFHVNWQVLNPHPVAHLLVI